MPSLHCWVRPQWERGHTYTGCIHSSEFILERKEHCQHIRSTGKDFQPLTAVKIIPFKLWTEEKFYHSLDNVCFKWRKKKTLHFIFVSDITSLKESFAGVLKNVKYSFCYLSVIIFSHPTLSSNDFDFLTFPLTTQTACLKNCIGTKLVKMEQAIK